MTNEMTKKIIIIDVQRSMGHGQNDNEVKQSLIQNN